MFRETLKSLTDSLNSPMIDTIRIMIKTKRLESSGEQNGNLSRKGSWMKTSRKTGQVCDLQYVYLQYVCNKPFYNNLSVIEFQFPYICHLCFSQVMMMMTMETKFEEKRRGLRKGGGGRRREKKGKIPLSLSLSLFEEEVFHR